MIKIKGSFMDYNSEHATCAPPPYSQHLPPPIWIVRNVHKQIMHNGVLQPKSDQGKNLCQIDYHNCVICQRFGSKLCQNPQPPHLPTFRVSEDPSFSYTRFDFARPLYVKEGPVRLFKLSHSYRPWCYLSWKDDRRLDCLTTGSLSLFVSIACMLLSSSSWQQVTSRGVMATRLMVNGGRKCQLNFTQC